jgi:hypothetical protein
LLVIAPWHFSHLLEEYGKPFTGAANVAPHVGWPEPWQLVLLHVLKAVPSGNDVPLV